MVASWASLFDGGGSTATCNQQQASTVGNLATAPATGNLPGLGQPISSNGDPITIGDVTDVPEPSSILMVGGGLALAAWFRRRRVA